MGAPAEAAEGAFAARLCQREDCVMLIDRAPKAIFEPVELKDGIGWYVRLTLPGRAPPHIGNFKTEAEAREWIEKHSAGWLKGYTGGTHG